jgi:hypothetical protein
MLVLTVEKAQLVSTMELAAEKAQPASTVELAVTKTQTVLTVEKARPTFWRAKLHLIPMQSTADHL